MVDTVVVGAGIGGLSAAISAATQGHHVRVLESGPRVGGKAGVTTVDGVEIDTGPSVLTMPDVFDTLLKRAGTRLDDEIDLLEPDPGFRYLYPDGVELDVFSELPKTIASVEHALGAEAARELEGFAAYAEKIWEAAAPNFVYGDAPSWRSVFGMRALSQLTRVDPFSSMWGAIRKRVRSPHLRMLFARYATYNGSDVRRAPATLNCISHVELSMGGFGVRGGMYALVRALTRVAERVGVEIQCDARVERIEMRHGHVCGVSLSSGALVAADAVIANADVAAVFQDLVPEAVAKRVKVKGEPSMSGHTCVVKAPRTTPSGQRRVAHTVVFPSDYLAEFRDIFDGDHLPRDPTVYLCAQTACHGRAGWTDHEPVFVMANAPAEPLVGERGGYDELERRVLERAVERGVLRREDRVVWRRTPADLARQFPGSRGAIYGTASNDSMAAFQRPPNRVAAVPGLYLASGSAHPGGGVPLAALSGMAAARALDADFCARKTG